MSDYSPLHTPGQRITRTASADIVGGQMAVVTGSGTVGPSAAASAAFVGVAAFDAKAGEQVKLESGGVQRPIASGAITAGDIVVTAAAGRVVTNAAPAAGQQVGVALSTAANGAPVEIQMAR